TEEVIERGEEREVLATPMRVMALEDVMVTKLLALGETHLDLAGPLGVARPLREQIDWADVRRRTDGSPYARAFFALAEDLGVGEPEAVSIGWAATNGAPPPYRATGVAAGDRRRPRDP